MAASGDSEPEPWPTARESLTYQEARNVLDAQRETLADIDDKALRTVRLTAVLLGLFVAAGRLAGPDLFDPGLSAVGIVLLFASIVSSGSVKTLTTSAGTANCSHSHRGCSSSGSVH